MELWEVIQVIVDPYNPKKVISLEKINGSHYVIQKVEGKIFKEQKVSLELGKEIIGHYKV